MKKIILFVMVILGTTLQAQEFDFGCDTDFGNLIDFMPSTTINAVDLNGISNVGENFTTFHIIIRGSAGVGNSKNTTEEVQSITTTHEFGTSTIHQFQEKLSAEIISVPSSDAIFNSYRIANSTYYEDWVLIKNGNSVDVIAKWNSDGLVDYALIIHKKYGWPQSQLGPNSTLYEINLYKVTGNDFDN